MLLSALDRDAALLVPRPFAVRRVRREIPDVRTLELEPAEGGAPLSFLPGQFTMAYVFGVGEVPLSISGDPDRPDRLVHTVRAVGSVTRAICGLKVGQVVGIRGPFGSAWPLREAEGRDLVIVAGGLGLAPLAGAIRGVLAGRKRYGAVALLVGARTPADVLFARQLERWAARRGLEVWVTVDSAPPGWPGEVGVVTRLIPRARFDPPRTTAFVCGPEVMMRFAAAELVSRGVPPDSIHLSMERNMKCAVGVCGHCQFGAVFVCKDGPVFPYARIESLLRLREV
jgi:NAD(P)H-flavin reductase